MNSRNSRRARGFNRQLATVNKRSSLLGKTLNRELDVIISLYANNNLGTPFYSFGTSTAAPVMSVNLTGTAISQFPEYAQLVRTYGLVKLNSVSYNISRASPLVVNSSIIGNTPPVFLQTSLTNYTAGSVTLQQSLATSDNCIEVNIQTYDMFSVNCLIPPCISSRSSLANDVFCFGSNTWTPTIINGVQTMPELYLNLGSLSTPSFQSGATSTAYLVATIHAKLHLTFAGPQSL